MPDSPDHPQAPTPPPAAKPAAQSTEASTKGRQAILQGQKDAPEPPAKAPPPPRAAARQASAAKAARSQGGNGPLLIAFVALLVLLLAAIGGAVWFYQRNIAPALQAGPAAAAASASPVAARDTAPLESSLNRANAKIQELQKQLDAQRQERELTQGRLQEMADRMALVIQQASFARGPEAPAPGGSGQGQIASLLPSVSPSTSELILLKERNRLAGFADTAIATGRRDALQRIVDAMMDPDLKNLAHAAQAEYKRVQAYYEISISIDPNYKLPVTELFENDQVRAEADLTPEQLRKLLLDHEQPWEVRLRSAYLLRGGSGAETDEALLRALKEDPSLDVAKQAQTSLERRIGRRFRLFDIPAIEAWWQTQGSPKGSPVPMKEPTGEVR